MISPATILQLRTVLEDLEHGRCRAPLNSPVLLRTLQQVLQIYDRNQAEYQGVARVLDRLEDCIERQPESAGAKLIVPSRKVDRYHTALARLRRFVADHE